MRTGGIDCRAQGATYVRLNVKHHRSVRIMRTGRHRLSRQRRDLQVDDAWFDVDDYAGVAADVEIRIADFSFFL